MVNLIRPGKIPFFTQNTHAQQEQYFYDIGDRKYWRKGNNINIIGSRMSDYTSPFHENEQNKNTLKYKLN